MLLYEKQVVIVTGGGNGIGQTIALHYANHGAKVIIWDKDERALNRTKTLLESAGTHTGSNTIDLSEPDQIVEGMRQAHETFGQVDILVNNAGLAKNSSPYDLTCEEWDYVLNTNLRGTFLCSREVAKIMRYKGGGSIVNIASTRAVMSEANWEAYAASKGGILALTHALAVSLGPDKITVNAISPGWIQTENYGLLSPQDHDQHPAGRVGRSDDIARACLYLTHPENDFITGTNLVIDGGMTRKMIYQE